jgi:type II secretory pathway component GspD/PulD (secretin)
MLHRHIFVTPMVLLLAGAPATALAQKPATPPAPPAEAPKTPMAVVPFAVGPITPLSVRIVISQYQGEKKISSMPYVLSVNSNDLSKASLRMGARVPVPSIAFGAQMPDDVKVAIPFQYQEVGTNIDCESRTLDDGRYRLTIVVDDSSIYPADLSPKGTPQAFRQFRLSNTVVLKDGQTTQFTTAADKLSGDIVKIDVTLTVVK